ncbi:12445_t:CDS:2 [Funneliformis mosseae]|uniref:12445_t:CDS:1 n=1 Tax=Funneliformis mosseae TaxID=27381 RepID=A0A9N8ZQC6_FUNMO|nr:12445_t:CDS:2 [Funneliformis mosseae]
MYAKVPKCFHRVCDLGRPRVLCGVKVLSPRLFQSQQPACVVWPSDVSVAPVRFMMKLWPTERPGQQFVIPGPLPCPSSFKKEHFVSLLRYLRKSKYPCLASPFLGEMVTGVDECYEETSKF